MEATHRHWLGNLLLVLGSVLVCFLALEIGLRVIYGNQPVFLYPQVRHVPMSYGYKPEPGQKGTFTLNQPVATNRFGFREREWEMPRPAGLVRVMVIGDSLTFGNAARVEDTYPKVLERLLHEHRSAMSVEVINTATQGWNTDNEEAFLRDEGITYQPSIVIVGFYPNDWSEPLKAGTTLAAQLSPDGRWDARPPWLRWLPYRTIFWLKRSAVVTFLRDRIAVATQGPDFIDDLLQNKVDLDTDSRVAYTYQLLLSMKRLCEAHHIPMVLAAIPSINLFWVPKESVAYLKHMRAFCERNAIIFADVSQRFWEVKNTNSLYRYPWDGHLSPQGHRLVAEQLEPVVAEVMTKAPISP